ncbi:NifB/NifX family molybdenum-iron cluster-binding protein [Nitratifractor sp.]
MKIAVPIEAESTRVFTRVGRAPRFAIYEEGVLVETRPNLHAHSHDREEEHPGHGKGHGHKAGHGGGHGHREHRGRHGEAFEAYSPEEVELHRKDLGNLKDIDVILCRAVGPNMKEALELSGIKVVKVRKRDGENAEELIANYLKEEKS